MKLRIGGKKADLDFSGSATKNSKPKRRPRWLIRGLIVFLALILLAGGAMAARAVLSLNKVIQKNNGVTADGLKGELELSKLKGEGEGRVNVLLLGTGDAGHAGEGLTDTIIVASIDPKTNDVVMLGIPRDLYVKIPGIGWDRINAAHALAEQQKPGTGPELAKKTVSEIINQPIHYFVRVDFTGLRSAVDALGGVDINNTDDLNDPEYPCEKNEGRQCGFKLKAGLYHMDGSMALKYARCRKGNCGDDYGRAKRQQGVVVAMRDKAMQLGNILNPAKVGELIGIVGDHLRTDISLDEMKRLVDLGRKVNSNAITNKVLDAEAEGLVKNSNVGAASVVIPTAGSGNYTAIRSFVRSLFIDGYIKQEAAKLELRNANAKPAAIYTLSGLLKSYGYNVIKTTAGAEGGESKTRIIDYTNGKKPYTLKYLENRLKVSVEKADPPAGSEAEIVIILGADYKPQNNN